MGARPSPAARISYSLGAVSRLTGLSPHVLRAWERRHGAVTPLRTPGGTRRYREADVARLRLLRACVAAGHPIGDVARLEDSELRRAAGPEAAAAPPLAPLLDALERMDASEAERHLGLQLAALGPRRFAGAVALPLLRAVGDAWQQGDLCVAGEHLASGLLRNLLGSALRPRAGGPLGPPILFATPSGERHELGTLVCAVVAADLGAGAIYLGPDLPARELVLAARRTRAAAVALGLGRTRPARQQLREIRALRRDLPHDVALWVGGPGSRAVAHGPGVERVDGLEDLERKVALLAVPRRGKA